MLVVVAAAASASMTTSNSVPTMVVVTHVAAATATPLPEPSPTPCFVKYARRGARDGHAVLPQDDHVGRVPVDFGEDSDKRQGVPNTDAVDDAMPHHQGLQHRPECDHVLRGDGAPDGCVPSVGVRHMGGQGQRRPGGVTPPPRTSPLR